MAQNALPSGASNRRAVFGLLDANGWGWAGIKATFWFFLIIFLLGYVPNIAYYFTVSNTVDVGFNFLSFVNWCPEENQDLPCPAPAGSVIPWQPSPTELALPAARVGAMTVQSGFHLYIVGGMDGSGVATAETFETLATSDGNYAPWAAGPALPEPRAEAAVTSLSGVPYIIGGEDAAGGLATTVFIGQLDAGRVTGWLPADGQDGRPDLTLPAGIAGAAALAGPDGLWLIGGRTADGTTGDVWRAVYAEGSTTLGGWEKLEGVSLPAPREEAAAALVGETILVAGGHDGVRATDSLFKLHLDEGKPVADEVSGEPEGWIAAEGSELLPSPRARTAHFNASGTLYLIGGVNELDEVQYSTLWGITGADGHVSWHYLDQSNLVEGRAEATAAVVGAHAFIIGGEDETGAAVADAWRGGLAPQPPFYRLGLVGATLPALSIKGEVGQQIGYINAMTAGMVHFAILVVIGYAYSHPKGTRKMIVKLTRGRVKDPDPDQPVA